jgi:hypothetical protein
VGQELRIEGDFRGFGLGLGRDRTPSVLPESQLDIEEVGLLRGAEVELDALDVFQRRKLALDEQELIDRPALDRSHLHLDVALRAVGQTTPQQDGQRRSKAFQPTRLQKKEGKPHRGTWPTVLSMGRG